MLAMFGKFLISVGYAFHKFHVCVRSVFTNSKMTQISQLVFKPEVSGQWGDGRGCV